MNDEELVESLLEQLREVTSRNSSTRNDEVPDEENLALGEFNDIFDIDIFFSRKPGMRRSIQLISSGNLDKNYIRLSCMTALASLCDTMISNKQLGIKEEDILDFMIGWLQMHKIKVFDGRKKN